LSYPVPVLDTGSQRHRPYPICIFWYCWFFCGPVSSTGTR